MPDHDAELGAIVATLSEAGMIEQYVNEDGEPALRLTPEGARVARQMGMGDDPDGLLDALLAAEGDQGARHSQPSPGPACVLPSSVAQAGGPSVP